MSVRKVIIIPALRPDKRLIVLCEKLRGLGLDDIVIIDDGSGNASRDVFDELERQGCFVQRHEKNLGKGAALKTGFCFAKNRFGSCIYITADADGQHLPEDIAKVADSAEENALVLGVRSFSGKNVPFRSKFGNRTSSFLFRIYNGVKCPDTQTGLRAIPPALEQLALDTDGERYEYEMNFLGEACRKLPLKYVPITTVYEDGNRSSHFRPVADSLRIYAKFLKFAIGSLTGAIADALLYLLFSSLLPLSRTAAVFPATALARIGSGAVNFAMNRFFAFGSKNPAGKELLKYGILFVGQMLVSAGAVTLLSLIIPIPTIIIKIVVDTLLFFVSYAIQKNWVFR